VNERGQFHSLVKQVLKPALVADGFRVSGNVYRRTYGAVIHVIALQGSIHGGQCCVCLGIHLTFLSPVGATGGCDPAKITEPECEFRSRLAPAGQSDYWWSYGATEQEARASAESIIGLYREVGVPYFRQFSSFPDDFVRVTPSIFASSAPVPFPKGGTLVRRALALSRIALRTGRIVDAKQFAEIGLAHVGPAVGLKNEFRKILAND
jgi:hypothetical protein